MIEKTVGNRRTSREEGETDEIQEESGCKIGLRVNPKTKHYFPMERVVKRTASSEVVRPQ
jgi:hypothetical protein